ncbi:MAG: serine acetyltransferase [Enterococcus lacertideformus]|uniref:Serine acetyltransferase n=1 Tax=Enterococcus lacertideformus TaxID=2771493 RepID=A0A931ASY4_9ENTE|nr:serine acetyltransferase [Enterococcus lacertideformus]
MNDIKAQPEFWSKVMISIYSYGHMVRKIPNVLIRRILLFPYLLLDTLIIRGLLNSMLPYSLKMGNGIKIWHPFGIIIHSKSKIGNNVELRHQVTIGKSTAESGLPIIGNNVSIGAGAKILGEIYIGDGSIVGANAVVTKSFPKNSVLVGCPAMNIAKKEAAIN